MHQSHLTELSYVTANVAVNICVPWSLSDLGNQSEK